MGEQSNPWLPWTCTRDTLEAKQERQKVGDAMTLTAKMGLSKPTSTPHVWNMMAWLLCASKGEEMASRDAVSLFKTYTWTQQGTRKKG